MHGKMKVFMFVVLFVAVVMLACGGSTLPATKSTPIPTVVTTPGVLQCADILTAKEGQTDSQSEEYPQSVMGKGIYFSGEVQHVYNNGGVRLVYDNTCGIALYNIPESINFAEGQHLEGYGTIKDFFLFLNKLVRVNINVNPDLLIIR